MFLRLEYNASTSAYEVEIPIDSSFESGVYKIWALVIEDTSGNTTRLFDFQDSEKKLESGEFEFIGDSEADTEFPVLESISVDRNKVISGDTVTVSIKATDNVGLRNGYIEYKKPITETMMFLRLEYNASTSTYEVEIPIDSSFEMGIYKIWALVIVDTSGNTTRLFDFQDSEKKLENGEFEFIGKSEADTEFPVLESISVDRNKVTSGDTVTVSVKATDNAGLRNGYIEYKKPITETMMFFRLKYNASTSAYEVEIPIDSSFEKGIYKIWALVIEDTSGNTTRLFDFQDSEKKLESGQFTFFKEENPPEFSSLYINQKSVESGQNVFISVEASDDTNLQEAIIYYVSPVTKTKISVPLTYNKEEQKFQGDFPIKNETEIGLWKVESIEIIDTNLNKLIVESTSVNLSSGDFNVIPYVKPLDVYLVSSNETWSNKTVNSDVYISPGSVLTVNGNVTVNGNIFTVGGLRSNGGLTINGELHASYMTFGYYQPSDGQAILSGSNSISRITISSKLLDDVPFIIYDTPLVGKGGSVEFTGATLPFVRVTINGQTIDLKDNGTFRIKGFDLNRQENLQVKLRDTQGYEYTKYFEVRELFVDEITKDTTLIKGKTQPFVKVVLSDNGQKLREATSDGNGYFQLVVTGLKENAELTFEVSGLDGTLITTKKVVVPDTTAPDSPTVESVYDTSTYVIGTTEPNGKVTVKAGSNELGLGEANEAGEFTISIPKQDAGTELAVVATDKAGNESKPTVITVGDKTAPAKPEVNTVSDQSTTVTGTTEADATVVVKSGATEIGKGSADGTGNYSITIAKQKAGIELTVFATDKAGNQSESTVIRVADKTAPNWPRGEMLEIRKIKDNSLLLKWPNASDNVGVASYVLYRDDTMLKEFPAGTTSFLIEYLDYEKKYTFKVVALDKAGNKSTSLAGEAVTIKDETPPTWPGSSKISVTDTTNSSITVTWTHATDENNIKEYKCFLNGVEAQGSSVNKCTFSGLKAGTNYEVKIEAVDKYSNKTSNGPTLTVRTKGAARISGASRYNTAVEISKSGWEKAETVILARGDNFPDALAGAPLAYKLNAPILLTDQSSLSFATKEEMKRLGAKKVIILGGSSAVSIQVADDVKALGIKVERIYGNGRSETANEIAKKLGKSNKVILAYGYNFPDALAIASYAAQNGYPILLTNKNDIASSTRKLVKEFGKDQVIVVGGESVITKKMIQSLEMGNIKRIAGNNRFETAANIINQLKLDVENVYIANGYGFADALTGSVLAAKNNAPMLLVNSDSLPWATQNMITKYPKANYNILGGPSAVNQEIVASLKGTGTGASSH